MGNVVMHPEYERLLRKYQGTVKQLSLLICEYDEMVLHNGPMLEARYMEAFGALDMAVYEAYVAVAALKRKIDLVQAYLNRNESPDLLKIEAVLKEEFESYQKELQRLAGKMAWAEALLKCEALSAEETRRLKELYREMARGLHPDLNPDLTEKMEGLWNRVQKAYKDGDLPLMEALYEIFLTSKDGHKESIEESEDAFAELEARHNRVKERVNSYLAKIAGLEKEYPFKFENLLADDKQVEKHQQELKSQTQGYNEQIKELQGYLDMLLAPVGEMTH